MKTALSKKFPAATISLVAIASVVSTVIAQATYEPNATITVTSNADAGGICPGPTCTLRQAITTAVAGDTIDFAAGITTIGLTSAELLLDKSITITGPGANLLTIERDPGAVSSFRIFNIPSGKTVTIRGLTISKGQLPGACCNFGGGILNNGSNLTVIGCAFVGNRAWTYGGGVHSSGRFGSPATLTVLDCFFGGNVAEGGGGAIYSDGSSSGNATLTINNSTFSGNRTTAGILGCVYNDGSQSGMANAQISNSTFYDDFFTANIVNLGNGGGHATLDIGNTILKKTQPASSNLINNAGTVISHGYNLANGAAAGLVAIGDQPNTEPMLGPLQDNGGPTLTRAPLINSPAVDQGKRDAIPALSTNFDQRGLIRPVDYSTVPNAEDGDGSDIGALELQAPFSVSRKTHDGVPFDIDLPLAGTAGVECRTGNVTGSHQVIATFPSPVTVTSASVTAGAGNVSNFTVSGGQVTVNLTGVADAQTIVLTLFGVNNGTTTNDAHIPMGVLLGDTNGDRIVNTGDALQTRNRSGQATDALNFRSDVNADGGVNSGDTLSVRSRSGTFLPPSSTPTPTPTPTPGACPLPANFDGVTAPALPTGWVATNFQGNSVKFVTTTNSPDSPPNSLFLSDQGAVSDKVVETPSLMITSAGAQMTFRHSYNMELSDEAYDGCVLEVSSPNINGGAYTDITDPSVGGSFVIGGYDQTLFLGTGNPIQGRMAWGGASAGGSGLYIGTVVNLGPNVNGQTIKLRFRMGTDESVGGPGWQIDNLSLTGGNCP